MKKQFRLVAIIAVLFTLAASVTSEAGPWRHRGYYGRGYYARPYYRPHVYGGYYARPILPPPPPVVVVGPRWGYGRPYYGGGWGYRRHYRRW